MCVSNAMLQGNMENYNQIVAQLRCRRPESSSSTTTFSTTHLTSWLEALIHVVAQLDRSHSALVEAVLGIPWSIMDERVVATYIKFVGCILGARPEWARRILDKIVRGFRYRAISKKSTEFVDKDSDITIKLSFDRHHALLQTLLGIVPTLPSILLPAITQVFPPKRSSRPSQVVFMSNVLRIIGYCQPISAEVWRLVVDRVIKMDLDIQVEIDDLEDDDGELDESVFGFDTTQPFDNKPTEVEDESSDEESGDDDDDDGATVVGSHTPLPSDAGFENMSDEEDVADDEDEKPSETDAAKLAKKAKAIKKISEMAAKLDSVLKVIFEHLDESKKDITDNPSSSAFPSTPSISTSRSITTASNPSRTNRNDSNHHTDFSATLLTLFEEQLMSTFSTHHVQFLLFYHSAKSQEFTDEFVGMLVHHALFNQETPLVNKVSAASYVSSFVARAKHVTKEEARRVMGLMTGWCEDWLDSNEIRTVHRSTLFYAVANSIFYLFCFRWKDFVEEDSEEDDEDIIGNSSGGAAERRWSPLVTNIRKIVFSPMNPLKVCPRTVSLQFAKVAHKTDFLYCYGLLEDRKPSSRSSSYFALLGRSSSSLNSPALSYQQTPSPGTTPATPTEEDDIVKKTLLEARIDSHFPFDPYKLPLSRPFVQPNYRDWEGFDDDDEDDEDDDDDDEDDDEDNEDDDEQQSSGLPMVSRRNDSQEQLGTSFEGMSI